MLLTITTTYRPATDLGYLLHKHPGRFQTVPLAFGEAHIFYPVATAERCTAALLLDVDPVGLTRRRGAAGFALQPYVNDRPYVASSLLSVALGECFRTALAGKSGERPELATTAIPLTARLPALPCRGGEGVLRRLFEPLGYAVSAKVIALDPRFSAWGTSPYLAVELSATTRLADLLTHLYVLIPVLDDEKHYWVGDDELEKLLRRGEGWLQAHPERELIVNRYLKRQRGLVREAMARLTDDEDADPDETAAERDREEEVVERRVGLHRQRLELVAALLKERGARRVLDLGCGEGKLIRVLLEERQFAEIVGVDVSARSLETAEARLRLDRAPAKGRVRLLHGSLTYRDRRLEGFDAAAVVEVIEHLDPFRLAAFGRALFGAARPSLVVVTTPNREYNALFEGLTADRFRHRDHRFEWTRAEFRAWADGIATEHGYRVRFLGVGPEDATRGAPTQVGVFDRLDGRDEERIGVGDEST